MKKQMRFNLIFSDISDAFIISTGFIIVPLLLIIIFFFPSLILDPMNRIDDNITFYDASDFCESRDMSLLTIEDKTSEELPKEYNNKYACYDAKTNFMLLIENTNEVIK